MSNAFRELLKKVGSGTHTGKDLSRSEAEIATRMILLGEATPAQIGAFLIAHRIKRPTSEELAGMLDAYDKIGPKLVGSGEWKRDKLSGEIPSSSSSSKENKPVTVLGTPYDGRDRTAPVTILTALILAAAGVPVLMHGGDRIPTKYGISLMEIWQELGVYLSKLSLAKVQELLEKTGLGFIYLPQHFPEAQELVNYRDQIGKRPPIATMELIWSPYGGEIHQVAGYVHPPTEVRFREVFKMRGVTNFTLVKGLEGSCDLPCDRTAIIAIGNPDNSEGFERLLLHPSDYGFAAKEVSFESTNQLITQMEEVLAGKSAKLLQAAIWNGGFYLWRCGICTDLQTGFAKAENLFADGYAEKKLTEIKSAIS